MTASLIQNKVFTDNIVIGRPIRSDGETELGDAFGAVSWFLFEAMPLERAHKLLEIARHRLA
jgi:hypothetical protein